jgi:hypothetical protein
VVEVVHSDAGEGVESEPDDLKDGINQRTTSWIMQRLLGFARTRNEHRSEDVEMQSKSVWPHMKRY